MKITYVKSGLLAPDFKNGDKFYVVFKNEITAVKIKNSYLTIYDGRIIVRGEFSTPKCEWGKGYIKISDNLSNITLNFEVFNEKRPFYSAFIYKTIKDARINNPYHGFIDIAKMEILNTGESIIVKDGSFLLSYWTYYSSENVPIKLATNFYSFIRENGVLRISSNTEPMKLNYWASRNDCQEAINKRLMRINVCDFDEDKKDSAKIDVNISIKISADASNEEIINAVLKTLHREQI